MSGEKRGKKPAKLIIKAGETDDGLLTEDSAFLEETIKAPDIKKEPAEKGKPAKKSKGKSEKAEKKGGLAKESENKPKAPKPDSPKKSAAPCEDPEPEQKTERSAKTEQVMRLVKSGKNSVNPVIIAGKSSIPRQLRGVEPLSRILRRESAKAYEDYAERVAVNVTELVIEENAGEILRRFNACDCEECVGELSRRVSEKVPARYVKLPRGEVINGSDQLDEIKEPLKKPVLSQMIRELLGNKRRSFHSMSDDGKQW